MWLIFSLTLFLRLAHSIPKLSLPIDSQIPPVARISHEFDLQFAPTTFESSDGGTLTYALQHAPRWLQLDSDSRTLHGTPSQKDLGTISFLLAAMDNSGTAQTSVTLVVVNKPSIFAITNVTSQLARAGPLAGPTSLVSYPSEPFNISFAQDTFSRQDVIYAATSADRSPLPAWVTFNAGTVSFSGVTEPPATLPQTFGVSLYASTIKGYSEASVTFSITVSDHLFLFRPVFQDITVSSDGLVGPLQLMNQLTLDGMVADEEDVVNLSYSGPDWVDVDSRSLELFGQAPSSTESSRVIVSAFDRFGDRADTVIQINIESVVFGGQIGSLSAVIGKIFDFQLPKGFFRPHVESIKMNFGVAQDWLHFNATTLTFVGRVPMNFKPRTIQATVTASLPSHSGLVTQTRRSR